jgi:hypothetical protein
VIPTLMSRDDFKEVLTRTVDAFRGLIKLDYLLTQALKHGSVWPAAPFERVTLADLPARI